MICQREQREREVLWGGRLRGVARRECLRLGFIFRTRGNKIPEAVRGRRRTPRRVCLRCHICRTPQAGGSKLSSHVTIHHIVTIEKETKRVGNRYRKWKMYIIIIACRRRRHHSSGWHCCQPHSLVLLVVLLLSNGRFSCESQCQQIPHHTIDTIKTRQEQNIPQPIHNPDNEPPHLRNLHTPHAINLQSCTTLQHPKPFPQLTHPHLPQIPQQPPHSIRLVDIVRRVREQQMAQLEPVVRQRVRLRAGGVRVFEEGGGELEGLMRHVHILVFRVGAVVRGRREDR